MKSLYRCRPGLWATLTVVLTAGYVLSDSLSAKTEAGPWSWFHRHHDSGPPVDGGGQQWAWVGSPDQHQVVVASLYNRYCIRCHGVDGRGTWDIPNLPDFTNPHWQASRTNAMIERAIIEGRWGCMPTFRAVISRQEAAALANYLRTLVPGTELSPPMIPVTKKAADAAKR